MWRIVLGLVIGFQALTIRAERHIFTSTDGRALEAEIVGYDAKAGMVEIERSSDEKRVKVKPTIFVKEDQQYIKDWFAANAFLSDTILKIECKDREENAWKEKETEDLVYTGGDTVKDFVNNVVSYEEIVFDFTFSNKGKVPLTGLTLAYCIYYEQSAMTDGEKPEAVLKTMYGTVDIPEITEKKPIKLSTVPVMIYEDNINPIPTSEGDQRRPGKGEIIGIRARVYRKGGNLKTRRDIAEPRLVSDDEKYPWTEESSPNER